ncbi:MAG: thioesterase family protein [Candidatus Binataceae bacterium]
MRQIPARATGHYSLTIEAEHLANSANPALPKVLATPMMILMMEQSAMDALVRFMEPDETSVGAAIDVEHLAATPVGHIVRADATITKVDGRRIQFEVRAFDEQEQIGRGVHWRVVVSMTKFNERLKSKVKN